MKQPKKKYEPTTKYLAIKNWKKYQAGTDRKGREIKAWVKDYCGKDIDDATYNSLTMIQRYLFDALCRVRGRSGKNICSRVDYISRACGVIPVERRFVGQSLAVLVLCGFLVPTNQEIDSSETQPETQTETETETKVPPPVAAGSPLPSGETKPTSDCGFVPTTTTTPKATSTDLRNWSETIPNCPLEPCRIADCIRYQLDVKKNGYFISRMSKGYVLKNWKRIVDDTPEDYVYDPDPMLVERTVPGVGDEEDVVVKEIMRKPKNAKERRILQGENYEKVSHNVKWLYAAPCPYGCDKGRVFVSDNPTDPIKARRLMGQHTYCRCLGE